MKRKKPTYTREFKLAILAQVNAGVPVPQVARENGLMPSLVFRWKNEFLEDPDGAFSGSGNPYKNQARIAELERTIGRLYSENEFLKKTIENMKAHYEEQKRKSELRRNSK